MNPLFRWLALRWFKGKVSDWRKDGNPVIKLLDGWKSRIVNLAYFGAFLAHLFTGGTYTDFVHSIVGAIGYSDPTPGVMAQLSVAATLAWSAWGLFDSIRKFVKQVRAGATATEVFSTNGYVKEAVAEQGVTAVAKIATGGVTPPALAEK